MNYRFPAYISKGKFKDQMKFSWNSLKISIAGAKLSHLVQKDKIWDHGSMVEQVRTIVILLKKAFHRKDAEVVKKCLTETAYIKMKDKITQTSNIGAGYYILQDNLDEISIIGVTPGKNGLPDKFTASVKFKKSETSNGFFSTHNSKYGTVQNLQFIREREWWQLDEIKTSS